MKLEDRLGRLHQRAGCLLAGSGTVALYVALKAAGLSGARVALPAGVCMNVPIAVLLSGNQPVYLDIDASHLGLSLRELQSSQVQAAIAVHAYGAWCGIEEIAAHCKRDGIFLIEDAAVAQGAARGGRPAGSFGDASVLSFGAGKIIDTGGGGALLSDDADFLREAANIRAALPAARPELLRALDELSSDHTRLYNEHYGRGLERHAAAFRERALALRNAWIHGSLPAPDAIQSGLDDLAANLERRRARWDKLCAALDGVPGMNLFAPPPGSVHWRFNILVEKGRDALLRELHRGGLKASSWYPPASLFLDPDFESNSSLPVATRVGDSILNLWVNDEVPASYAGIAARTIGDAIRRENQAKC